MNERTDFAELIPELPRWNDGAGIEPESWIGCTGNYELAIGYSLVFWPRFIAADGYVLRAEQYDAEMLRNWETFPDRTRQSIEGLLNHVHIADIHYEASKTEAQLRYLGRILKQTLEAKLAYEFPGRKFEVVFNDEPGLELIDYQVTFWQSED